MQKFILIFLSVCCLYSCKEENKEMKTENTTEVQDSIPVVSNDSLANAVIYEANIRQYSSEGTFNAFTKDIPQLKEMGVKVIWLMPIYPISEVKRKAADGRFAEEIKDVKEREKILGSYYAVSNYTEVNPKFGTMEDFQNLVDTAHENGMYVILDWVANHTGWDNKWITEHKDFYTQNDKGEIIDPINPATGESWGWTDTADLNYDNKDLWKEMTDALTFWVQEHQVDGFRADVAGEVPTEFWDQAVDKMNEIKPIFMLAESEDKDLFHHAFDMGYNWQGHHIMNEIAQGKADVSQWDDYMKKIDTTYEKDDYLMSFVTNHDENSWSGTVKERMGDAAATFTALTFVTPGMPLIYSGQEYGLDRRLKFFEKDSIPKQKGKEYALLEKLGKLKNNNPALTGGKTPASYTRIQTSNDKKVLAFERGEGENKVIYVANLSKSPVKFTMDVDGNWKDYINSSEVELKKDQEMNFSPWEYKILTNR